MTRRNRRGWGGRSVTACAVVALGVGIALPTTANASSPDSARAHQATPSAAGVPKNFKAQSMSWLNANQAFVLGKGKCAPRSCSDVVATTDAGKTWSLVGSMPVPIQGFRRAKPLGVSEMRFGTSQVGWAYDPLLVKTVDGGKTWSTEAIPGNGTQVLAVGANSSGAYAVVSSCRFGRGLCKAPLTFWHSTLKGDTWTQINLDLPSNVSADIDTFGKTVYVVDNTLFTGGDQDKLYASTDGKHFSARPSPCDHTQDLALTQAVAISATDVDLLCIGDPGMSKAVKTVYRSTDTGKTTSSAGQAGLLGIQSELAASPSGNLAMSSQSDGSFIYVNDGGGTTWTMPVGIGDGGIGWNDIVYTSDKVAWVVYAPAAGFQPSGVLYVTRDAGASWAPSPF